MATETVPVVDCDGHLMESIPELAEYMDPDLRRDIVSLGFVKNLTIDGGTVAFDIELTTPACPVKDKM